MEAAARYIALDNGCINPVRNIESGLIYELDTVKERNGQNMTVECYAGDGEIYLEIGLNEAKWMVLALPYSSKWKCYADDKETNIYKGNTMYMAVRLEEGEHEIVFRYKDISFYIGIVLSLVSLCIMLFTTKSTLIMRSGLRLFCCSKC